MATAMSQQAGDDSAAQQAKQAAQDKAQQAQEKVQDAAAQAGGQARERMRSQVDERSTQAGQQIGSTAETINKVAESLEQEGKEGPARAARQAAERAQRMGSYLERSNSDQLLSDVEDFGRQRPWAVALAAAGVGFAAARFLKASSSQRYQSRSAPAATPQLDPPAEPFDSGPLATTGDAAMPTPGMGPGGLAPGGTTFPQAPPPGPQPGAPPTAPAAG